MGHVDYTVTRERCGRSESWGLSYLGCATLSSLAGSEPLKSLIGKHRVEGTLRGSRGGQLVGFLSGGRMQLSRRKGHPALAVAVWKRCFPHVKGWNATEGSCSRRRL